MRKLKLFFACLLMAVLSIGQVWGGDVTTSWTASSGALGSGIGSGNINTTVSGTSTTQSWSYTRTLSSGTSYTGWSSNCVQLGKNGGVENLTLSTSNIPGTIKSVSVECSSYQGKHNVSITVGETSYLASTATASWTTVNAKSGTGTSSGTITISFTGGTRALYIKSITVVYNNDAPSTPTVSADPEEVEDVAFAGVTNQTIDLTYENITDYETEVSVHPNADGTGTLSPAWLTASISSPYSTVTYSVAANEGAARTAYIKVRATAGNKEATTIIPVSQVKYSAPTGTFELFSGDIEEGDYVLVGYQTSSSKYYAMNSTVTSNQYLGITEVSIDANDQIVNPDASLVWTIEQSTNGYYIKQGSAYLDDNATSNKNYAQTVAEPTTTSEWTFAYDNTWTITNHGTETTKKTLSFNISASRVACYTAIQSGNTCFYLYKKVDGAIKPSAGLAFDAAQKLAKVAGTLTAPNLSTAEGFDGTVTYASSDEAVVKVNASTGAITEIVAAGKAVITAHSDETENFKEGSASYTIFVAEQAGTSQDPLTETSAKALIDAGCTMNVYVKGTVNSVGALNTQYGSITLDLAAGFRFYAMLNEGGVQFTENPFVVGDVVTAVGDLKKHQNTTYELDMNCVLVERIAYTTPKTHIVSDIDNPITVAAAIGYIDDPVTYDLTDDVWVRGVVTNVGQTNGSSPVPYIDVKDANAENSFRFYNYTVNSSITEDPQQYDILIATGKLDKHNTTYELNGCEVVNLVRPDVAVESVELDQNAASIEVGETVSLTATVNPNNASNKAITWSVQSGSEYATVDAGVVTGILAGGTAVIRAASDENASIYAECTVTVTAVDPTVHHVTFIAGTDQSDETSITKDGITISATTFNNGNYYQCYSGEAMTVSSTVGNITKIEFTCTTEGTAKYGPGNWDFTGYSYSGANGSWTGSAETVEFGNASQQVRMTLITVTYKEDNRAAAGLAWNPADDIEITVGDAFSAPALLNPNSIAANEITISSDNTELATVTAGVVALVADATGTATITATFAGNDDYKPATISYNITVNEAGLDNVTFDSSEDHAESGETTITKGGFTLSFTSGSMDGTQAEYRLYKGQTMTLSSTDYKIKKIEFTCTSGNPISGFADATGLDKDNNEWTGESNTLELTASNAQVRMTKIKVFYVDDSRAASGLAWDPADDIELTVGDAFSAPTLLNPNSIDASEFTIESSNENVATINNSGEVELVADATGTTTITATFAGNDDFKPATISYKITVNPAYSIYVTPSLNVNFGSVEQDAVVADKKVTVTFTNVPAATLTLEGAGSSAFAISPAAAMTASGDITISASSANVGTFAATLTISDDDNNAESKVVNLSITVNEPVIAETPVSTSSEWVVATAVADGMEVLITGVKDDVTYAMSVQSSNGNNRTTAAGSVNGDIFTPGENTMSFTLVAQEGDNKYALRTSNEKYLFASSGSANRLGTRDEIGDDGKAVWTISIGEGNVASIVANCETTNWRNTMRFNQNGQNNPVVACYASASQDDIKLYVPKPAPTAEIVRGELNPGQWGTLCPTQNISEVEGAEFFQISYLEELGGVPYNMVFDAISGTTLEAGKPYFFIANAGEIRGIKTGTVLDEADQAGVNGFYGYIGAAPMDLTWRANYDGNENNTFVIYNNSVFRITGDTQLKSERCYININSTEPSRSVSQPAPGRRRINMAVSGTQVATGIDAINASEKPVKMMIDGQLFIIRGEKMYDATGRLVK